MPRPAKALLALLSALAVAAVPVSGASAATEFGNNCTANQVMPGQTIMQTVKGATGGTLPLEAPVSGVITSWKLTLIVAPGVFPQQLKVLRPTSDPKAFAVVGESQPGPVGASANSFETRIPVQQGDLLGIFGTGPAGTLLCKEQPATDKIGQIAGNPPVGSTATVGIESEKLGSPVSAVIEPDADHDGYGDETQDKCVQSAALHDPCPALGIEAFGAAGRKAVSVYVTTNIETAISVNGTVNLPKRRRARSSAVATLTAPTQTVGPGRIATFQLTLSKQVLVALARLPRNRSLALTVFVEGRNAAGSPASRSLALKLRGTARRR